MDLGPQSATGPHLNIIYACHVTAQINTALCHTGAPSTYKNQKSDRN